MRTIFAMALVSVALGFGPAGRAQVVAVCGDGVPEAPEACDDGNLVDGDGCDSNCTPTGCGNGVVTAGEECDDGNVVPGDCCSALCLAENQPPVCSEAAASVGELWPPNHRMVPIDILGVTDPDGDPLVVRVTAIAQDEPVDAQGDGATCPDAAGLGLDAVELRSERSGRGDGRFYHVAFEAVDRCDAVCTGEVAVVVRHDRGKKKVPGDGGPLHDSTLGFTPCEGGACDPVDCVPDPADVDECDGDGVPSSVTAKLAKATAALERGRGKKGGRLAARTLRKAANRTRKAAARGDLSPECGVALATALDDGGECVVCRLAD